jgi:hypothetical protein
MVKLIECAVPAGILQYISIMRYQETEGSY